jgi:hypothetical protein
MDAHDDKIWALDLSPCGTALFSGGADSKIAVWRDTTKERDDAAREAEENNILMEQKLSNHLRNKRYEEALEIALKLDKPNQVLRVRLDLQCQLSILTLSSELYIVHCLCHPSESGTDRNCRKGHKEQPWNRNSPEACSKLGFGTTHANSKVLQGMEHSFS